MKIIESLLNVFLFWFQRLLLYLRYDTEGTERKRDKFRYERANNTDVFFVDMTKASMPDIKNVQRLKIQSARILRRATGRRGLTFWLKGVKIVWGYEERHKHISLVC